jgi:hypothetical protein
MPATAAFGLIECKNWVDNRLAFSKSLHVASIDERNAVHQS